MKRKYDIRIHLNEECIDSGYKGKIRISFNRDGLKGKVLFTEEGGPYNLKKKTVISYVDINYFNKWFSTQYIEQIITHKKSEPTTYICDGVDVKIVVFENGAKIKEFYFQLGAEEEILTEFESRIRKATRWK